MRWAGVAKQNKSTLVPFDLGNLYLLIYVTVCLLAFSVISVGLSNALNMSWLIQSHLV